MKSAILTVGICIGTSISVCAQIDSIYKPSPAKITDDRIYKKDTSKITDPEIYTLPYGSESVVDYKKKYDSIYKLLVLQRFRLNQLVYYNRIVIRNPSQLKFLKGWLNRALQ